MRRALLAVVVAIAILLALVSIARWDTIHLDGVEGELLAILAGEDTAYSARYSSRAFRSIKVGMSEAEVESIIGPALESAGPYGDERELLLQFSRSPSYGSYRVREVELRGGRVVRIYSGLWFD